MNIFFNENWHEASKQTQKYKFDILLLKGTILDPQKSAILVFEENPPPKKICLRVSALIQL